MNEDKPITGPENGPVQSALPTFEREWQIFQRERAGLLASGHEGHFAVIQGDNLIGVFETEDDALEAGYGRFGLEGFLVQPIVRPEDEPIYRTVWSRLWRVPGGGQNA